MSQYRDPEQYRPNDKRTGDTIENLFDAVERAEANAAVPAKPVDLVELAWQRLKSSKCICGGKKEIRRSFCRFCYYDLPRKMRLALWTPMPAYAVEYEKARQFLIAKLAERKPR